MNENVQPSLLYIHKHNENIIYIITIFMSTDKPKTKLLCIPETGIEPVHSWTHSHILAPQGWSTKSTDSR